MNTVLIALGTAIITAFGSYLIAKRTTSGSVDTSEAATLWQEGTNMRQELRDEVVSLRKELKDTKQAWEEEVKQLRERIAVLEAHDPKQ